MKKKVKTQNGKQPTDDSYEGQIREVHYIGEHITALTLARDTLILLIKQAFGKTQENIEFELNKLRKD